MNVLHLEDNEEDAELYRALLSKEWPRCRIARMWSGPSFEAALRRENFDLILSDHTMPGFNGLDALRLARSLSPGTPFIFLSGTIGEERALDALKGGASDYILKGSHARFISAVQAALANREQERARRRAEESLHQTREQFRHITESISDFIVLLDVNGHALYANPAFRELVGDEEHSADFSLFDRVHAQDRALVSNCLKRADDRSIEDLEYRIVDSTGRVRFVEARVRATSQEGNAPTLLLAGRDITERKGFQERLLERASLLENARDAIALIDMHSTISQWNDSAERIYGHPAEAVLGRNAREVLCHGHAQRFDEAFALTLAHGEWQGEFRTTRPDGVEVIVDSSWSLVNDAEGRPKSILWIDTDVTSRKRLERELQRSQRIESLGMLAGGIAHDLNNILTPITMAVGLLQGLARNEDDRSILDTLEQSVDHGTDLVRQILLFARGGEGQRTSVAVPALLADMKGLLKSALRRGIDLGIKQDPEIWPTFADATQIKQVLMNLCVNARDAMPGGGRIDIMARNVQLGHGVQHGYHGEIPAGRYVEVSVRDNGNGIPPAILEKIFDPFFTTKELGKGTGLGLSTIAAVVKNHDGAIQVESIPGSGTTFRIYLPAMAAPPKLLRQFDPTTMPRGNGQGVLVIDDDPGIRLVTEKSLTAQGYVVHTAEDGAIGLAECARLRSSLHLIICDQKMPGMTGSEVLAQIHQQAPELKLICMSGFLEEADAIDNGTSFPVGRLAKPMDPAILLRLVHDTLFGTSHA